MGFNRQPVNQQYQITGRWLVTPNAGGGEKALCNDFLRPLGPYLSRG